MKQLYKIFLFTLCLNVSTGSLWGMEELGAPDYSVLSDEQIENRLREIGAVFEQQGELSEIVAEEQSNLIREQKKRAGKRLRSFKRPRRKKTIPSISVTPKPVEGREVIKTFSEPTVESARYQRPGQPINLPVIGAEGRSSLRKTGGAQAGGKPQPEQPFAVLTREEPVVTGKKLFRPRPKSLGAPLSPEEIKKAFAKEAVLEEEKLQPLKPVSPIAKKEEPSGILETIKEFFVGLPKEESESRELGASVIEKRIKEELELPPVPEEVAVAAEEVEFPSFAPGEPLPEKKQKNLSSYLLPRC